MHFQIEYLFSVTTYDMIFVLTSGILSNTSSMKKPDIYYSEAIKITSQASSNFTKNARLRFILSK